MRIGYKILGGLVALLFVVGINANVNRVNSIFGFNSIEADSVVVDSATSEVTPVDTVEVVPGNMVDEVIWVVGDEAILRSDVEAMRAQGEAEGVKWHGDPDCSIPEQLAVQKLYLHQAAIDSITVSEADVAQSIDFQIQRWIDLIGSREKLEEYRKQSVTQMRQEMHDEFKNQELIRQEQQKLVEDVVVTPAEVRDYFRNMPADSIPFVPTTVEVEILTQDPKIEPEEINRVKEQLREYTDRVTKGETTFSTLARLYSEDPGSARQGGEIGYSGRGQLDPAYANIAFNLTDPQKISKVVESEFGFHIIQLIDKRGDKVNTRHILLKPQVSPAAIDNANLRLDSIKMDINADKFTFESAASYLSDDKETKNNQGLMAYTNQEERTRTAKFQMKDLPTEIARVVDTLKVNEISAPFEMINAKGKTVCAIIKLKERVDGHTATITEDFQVMKNVVLAKMRDKKLHDWVVDKIKHTYVRMNDDYKNCNFEYQGWIK